MNGRVALLWPGDGKARASASLEESRYAAVARALREAGLAVEPAVYADEFADEVRDQVKRVDAVLVWVNPIEGGRDRSVLDAMLREVAARGVIVSASPDVILKMGTKEVLHRTRDLGWGTDTRLYASVEELRRQLPLQLRAGGARVLKQYRGNGGNGVWKVEQIPGEPLVRVRHAARGSSEEAVPLTEFLARCESYFAGAGRMVDQPYQERLTEGMIRCYVVRDRVEGFGHQAVNALFPAPPGALPASAPQPGPRLYHPPTKPEFQGLKATLEREWIPAMQSVLDIAPPDLPFLWDADFLYGPKTPAGEDTFVLCEINVSSVFPFPDHALAPLARAVAAALGGKGVQ